MAKNKKKPRAAFPPIAMKSPKTAVEPYPSKRPFAIAPSHNSERPSWRISKMEMVDPFGWHELQRSKLDDIRARLSSFESMTWNQILVEGKKQHHSIEVIDLSPVARKRLHEIGLGDTAEVVSLALTGRERIIGIRQGAALLILWWDPKHEVCPSELKNT